MIVHLATRGGRRSLKVHVPFYSPALWARIKVLTYDRILEAKRIPRGVYLFTDMERMDCETRELAAALREKMSEHPKAFRTLNHPTRSLRRFDLLRKLHEIGDNDFNVHRYCDLPEEVRYPAFIRYEDRHNGPMSEPVKSEAELERDACCLIREGMPEHRMLVVEYTETVEPEGIYRKYGAFRVGGTIVPRHMYIGTEWCLKQATNQRRSAHRQEELEYVRTNPHKEKLQELFDAANLQYGRIDYTISDGKFQTWEINDNPQLVSNPFKYERGRWPTHFSALDQFKSALSNEESLVEPGPALDL